MKRLVEDTFWIRASEIAKAVPKYTQTGAVSVCVGESNTQRVQIVSTPSNLRGLLRWFLCPGCSRRVAKLYLPDDSMVFLCRKCHDLGYRAQQIRSFKELNSRKKRSRKVPFEKVLQEIRHQQQVLWEKALARSRRVRALFGEPRQ